MNCAYLTDFTLPFTIDLYGDPFPLISLNGNHGREEKKHSMIVFEIGVE